MTRLSRVLLVVYIIQCYKHANPPNHLAECRGSAHPWAQAKNGISLVYSVTNKYLMSKFASSVGCSLTGHSTGDF